MILEHMNQGVCMFDGDHKMIYCNQKYLEVYDLRRELALKGTPLMDILQSRIDLGNYPDKDAKQYIADRLKLINDKKFASELHHLRNGKVLSIRHQPLECGGWLTTHEDITELYVLREDIDHLAFHDYLTDLPNRLLFNNNIQSLLVDKKSNVNFALLFLDLDGFKTINDTYGHAIGDKLLKIVAKRLLTCVRSSDIVSRLGGDEFAIILTPDIKIEDTKILASRIISEIEHPYSVSGHRLNISISIGIALPPSTDICPDELLSHADTAMYQAKNSGGGRYHIAGLNDEKTSRLA